MQSHHSRYSLLSLLLLPLLAVEAQHVGEPLIVTASRVSENVDDSLAAVTVINREAIVASGTQELQQLLRQQAGVDLARTGGPGSSTSVFLRGSNSNHVLVLVDGVRVASVNTGAFAWEHLPLESIERIEIVRGPRASRYGSDAIGGVIQIFTRQDQGSELMLGAGSYGAARAHVSHTLGSERTRLRVQAGYDHLDGFSAQNEAGFAFDPDDDGYRNRVINLSANHDLDSGQLGLRMMRSEGDVEFDQGESDTLNQLAALTWNGNVSESWRHSLSLGNAREDIDTPVFAASFRTRRNTLDWIHDLQLSQRQRLVLGVNALDERGRSNSGVVTDYDESRQNMALSAAWHGRWGGHSLELATRHDRNSEFGGKTTSQLAWGWDQGQGLRSYAHIGEGFRSPNLNEQYSPGFGGLFAGNPELSPERSLSAEVGVELRTGSAERGQLWSASAYRTRVRDLISFSGGDTFRAENIARADIDGFELGYRLSAGRISIGGQATIQNTEDRASGLALLRRPEQKLAVDARWQHSELLSMSVDTLVVSSRREFGGDLPGYSLVGLAFDWQMLPSLRLGGRIENLLDRDYELARGFNTPGRSVWMTLRWSRE